MAASLVSLKNCIKKPVDPIEFLPFLPADNNHNNDQLTTRESVSSDKVLAASMENKNADDYYQSQKVVRKNAEALTILLKTRFILFLG